MQNGLLDFSDHKRKTVRDVLFIEDGWDARFERWQGPKWPRARMSGVPGGLELVATFHQFAAAMLSSMLVQGVHAKARLVLAAVQVTKMHAHSLRGPHKDPPAQGDLVVGLTVNGTGTVFLGASTSELPSFTHELAGTWYVLGGKGLRDYNHAVETGDELRLSVTYRYMHAT